MTQNLSTPDREQRIAIPPATGTRSVWLQVGTLLDGVSTRPLKQAHLVYNGTEILFVGDSRTPPPAACLNPGQRSPDLELPDFTVLPGLTEAHAHLFLEGGELDLNQRVVYLKQPPEALLAAARTRLEKLVRLGVLAIRDAGDKNGVGLALSKLCRSRREEAEGGRNHKDSKARLLTSAPTMPYIDSPGAAIHHAERYGSFMAQPIEEFRSLEECVKARVTAGADRIKLIPTGIINFRQGKVTAEPQMTIDEVSRLVNAAKSFGKQTFAHASGDIGIDRAIEGGVDSVEHGFFIREDQLALMRDRGIAWVPTFAPVQAQVDHADRMGWEEKVVSNLKRILDQHASSLVKAYERGVQIIAGSDAGSYGVAHGYGLLDELELMERAGLPALAVINSATGTGSSRLAFKEKFGQIKPGYRSRFILTRHSPLEGITNLCKERFVLFDGSVFDSGSVSTCSSGL